VTHMEIENILRKRVEHRCEDTAVSTGKQCRHIAAVGSLLCRQHYRQAHGGNPPPQRYIKPEDFPVVVAELVAALGSVTS